MENKSKFIFSIVVSESSHISQLSGVRRLTIVFLIWTYRDIVRIRNSMNYDEEENRDPNLDNIEIVKSKKKI